MLSLCIADTWWARFRGIKAFSAEQAQFMVLCLRPCQAVHTFGMPHAIDILFLDKNSAVLRYCVAVPAWRFRWHRGACAVIEAPAYQGRQAWRRFKVSLSAPE